MGRIARAGHPPWPAISEDGELGSLAIYAQRDFRDSILAIIQNQIGYLLEFNFSCKNLNIPYRTRIAYLLEMLLDGLIRAVPSSEKLFIGGDLNGHVGTTSAGFEAVHGGFGYGSRNQEGEEVLDFAVAFDLMIANTFFRKRESHLVTFSSGQHSSQIDFVLTRRKDKRACLGCKVIPEECVVSQHKRLVADFRF